MNNNCIKQIRTSNLVFHQLPTFQGLVEGIAEDQDPQGVREGDPEQILIELPPGG